MTPTDRQLWRANRKAAAQRARRDEALPNPFMPAPKKKRAKKKAPPARRRGTG
jgi:hypothetical protein